MKKISFLILTVLLSFSLLQATYVGKVYFKSQDGKPKSPFFTTQSHHLRLFFDEQIKIGNLKLTKIQNDPIAEMEHHRYSQHYKGLEVYGGQIIKHYKKSEMVGINGEYYRIYDVNTTPVISKDEAVTTAQEFYAQAEPSIKKQAPPNAQDIVILGDDKIFMSLSLYELKDILWLEIYIYNSEICLFWL